MDSLDTGRSRLMIILIAAVGFVFLARLFYIQVLDQNYKQFAENNSIRHEIDYPERGLIYDRSKKILVRNSTIYDVMVIPAKIKNLDTVSFCKLLEVDINDFRNSLAKARFYNRYVASPIVRQITAAQYGRFQERLFEFRGFFMQERTTRVYPFASAAHAIGYLGEVNEDEIGANDNYYRMGDYIGKSGLEKQYESVLRGRKGEKKVMVDVMNREQGRYMNGAEDIPSVAGQSLMTGIDLDLQQYAEKLLKGKKGSVVAIEPSTGEILAMASTPTYDPNMLLGRERAKNYAHLVLDPDKPMFNRAISARYPPGSTVKPMEALIAMSQHIIGPNYTYSCSGGYHLGAHTIGCHASGTFNVHGSIQMSCNTYYCNLFKMMLEQPQFGGAAEGLQNWANGLQLFNVGKKTGLDVPNENKGLLPSVAFYNKHYGERAWKATTVISLGIGQAEICMTPLQLANEAAIIANRGYYITPHFVKAIANKDSVKPLNWDRHETHIDTGLYRIVVDAMQDVVEHGTAYLAKVPGIQICGKTGTAENPHGEDHAVFICFAPKDHPKIAISVVIENAGFGGTWAAPLASLLVEKYLNDSTSRPRMEEWVLSNAYLAKAAIKEAEKKAKQQQHKAAVAAKKAQAELDVPHTSGPAERKRIAASLNNKEAIRERYD